jgi:glycerol uptake facilitator-like aquaporin
MNPAITIFFNRFKKNNHIFTYMFSQIIGALIGALLGIFYFIFLALWFFNVTPAPYDKEETLKTCILDTVA